MEGTPVTVRSVTEVGPETVTLELETPPDFDALPGQFVLLRAKPADDVITRYYTLSSPGVGETFELTVGVDPEGDLSPWLAACDPGETVYVEGPFGEITYERDCDVVAIAGGPGIGPAVAIAEAAQESGHEAVVIYQDDQPAHEDRLAALERAEVAITVLESDDALATAIAEHVDDGQLYGFGFADFVTAVADAIEAAGGDPDDALIENFG